MGVEGTESTSVPTVMGDVQISPAPSSPPAVPDAPPASPGSTGPSPSPADAAGADKTAEPGSVGMRQLRGEYEQVKQFKDNVVNAVQKAGFDVKDIDPNWLAGQLAMASEYDALLANAHTPEGLAMVLDAFHQAQPQFVDQWVDKYVVKYPDRYQSPNVEPPPVLTDETQVQYMTPEQFKQAFNEGLIQYTTRLTSAQAAANFARSFEAEYLNHFPELKRADENTRAYMKSVLANAVASNLDDNAVARLGLGFNDDVAAAMEKVKTFWKSLAATFVGDAVQNSPAQSGAGASGVPVAGTQAGRTVTLDEIAAGNFTLG